MNISKIDLTELKKSYSYLRKASQIFYNINGGEYEDARVGYLDLVSENLSEWIYEVEKEFKKQGGFKNE